MPISARFALYLATDKRFWKILAALFLIIVLIVTAVGTSCTGHNLQTYALETVSVNFEPFVTPVNNRITDGEQLNTRLLYSAYITLFDNQKHQTEKDIMKKLVTCFYTETTKKVEITNKDGNPVLDKSGKRTYKSKKSLTAITDSEIIFDNIQEKFSLTIEATQRQYMVNLSSVFAVGYTSSDTILTKNLNTGDGSKTNIGLTDFAWNALKCKSGYVFGAVGQTITMPFLQQQQHRFIGNMRADLTNSEVSYIFRNFGGHPAFDCIGLIKAYSWMDESTGKISASNKNAMQDCSANGLLSRAKVRGNISNIPETPGLTVHMTGHVGVYIGGGEVIESQGNHAGIKKTKLKGRGWKYYVQVPTLTYVQSGTYTINGTQVTISDGKIVD